MTTRLYRFDNIKFLLIVLVVFALFIETIDSGKLSELYLVIYTLHMPAFIFLTGFFSKFGLKKIIQNFFLPYLVFQTLYQIFNAVVLCRTHDFTLQYTTPYWIMWYLMVSAMYHLILPLIETNSKRNRLLIFASSVVISLAVGYDDTVGYYLSLSRFFNFMPYFIAGHYANGYFAEDSCSKRASLCYPRNYNPFCRIADPSSASSFGRQQDDAVWKFFLLPVFKQPGNKDVAFGHWFCMVYDFAAYYSGEKDTRSFCHWCKYSACLSSSRIRSKARSV